MNLCKFAITSVNKVMIFVEEHVSFIVALMKSKNVCCNLYGPEES